MALVQKVRAKLRRSSCEVTEIKIKAEQSSNRVIDKSSLAEFEASLTKATESLQKDVAKAYEKISALKQREKQSRDIIVEKDRQILELEELLSKVKSEKLKEENERYQDSLRATKKFIDNLEKEVHTLTSQIKDMKLKSDAKLLRAKRRLVQTKQDYALEIFELKQRNLALSAEIEKLQVHKQIAKPEANNVNEEVNTVMKEKIPEELVNLQPPRSLLILELSEKIQMLEVENKKLLRNNRTLRSIVTSIQTKHPQVLSGCELPP